MSDVQEAVERLRAKCEGSRSKSVILSAEDARNVLDALAASEQARERAEGERDAAVRHMSDCARQAGEAKGRLEVSELVGVVEGWRDRAEAAERQRDAAVEALRQARGWVVTCSESAKARRDLRGIDAILAAQIADRSRYLTPPARAAQITEGLGALQAVQGELGAGDSTGGEHGR